LVNAGVAEVQLGIGWHGLTVEQYHVKLADYKYKLQEVTIEEEEAFKLLEKKKI